MKKGKHVQQEVIEGAPLRYAPVNELGVVFLFAHVARKKRVRVDEIRPGFPDCIGYQKIHGAEKRIRIEFEYKSRNFKQHRHDPRKCDWLVCWEHNWPDAPKSLEIVELRRDFGLGFNVWIVPIGGRFKEVLRRVRMDSSWSAPSQGHADDLILYYLTNPEKHIVDIFKMTDRAAKKRAIWKPGKDYMAPIKRVCRLKAPVFLEDLQEHRVLSTASFIRGRLRRPSRERHPGWNLARLPGSGSCFGGDGCSLPECARHTCGAARGSRL